MLNLPDLSTIEMKHRELLGNLPDRSESVSIAQEVVGLSSDLFGFGNAL